MVNVCRRGSFLLPGVEKAMPSRAPETTAAKQATSMMTFGGAPHPTKQIQQGPSFCASCGKSHRLGTVCSKAIDDAFLDLLAKGVITIAGQKRGNPYRDDSTGRFAASPAAGGGGGGAGAQPDLSAPTAAPASAPGKQTAQLDVGRANTMQAAAPSAPSAPPTSSGGASSSSPVSSTAPAGGNESAGGGSTIAGKRAPQTAPQQSAGSATVAGRAPKQKPQGSDVSPDEIAAAQQKEAENQKMIDALLGRIDEKPAGGGDSERINGPFSHNEANAAYHKERNEAMMAGVSEDDAHRAAMRAGQDAFNGAMRRNHGQQGGPAQGSSAPAAAAVKPGAPATQQSPPPQMSGPGGTQVSGPPQMSGPNGTQVSGAPTGMPVPAAAGQPATPAAPAAPASRGSGGQRPMTTPGGKGKTGGEGFLPSVIKPWQGAAGSMGAGMFTPGGTAAATGNAAGGSAHSLLTYGGQDKQQPAANQRAQQVKQLQGRSAAMQQQTQQSMNRLRGFLGQSAKPAGTP